MKTLNNSNRRLWKSLGQVLVLLSVTGLCGVAAAQTPLPIYEPFPSAYTNTSDEAVQVPAGGTEYRARRLGNGDTATLWSIGNSPGGGSTVVVGGAAALSYPGLYQDPSPSLGLFIRTNNTTANRNRGILFPTIDSGSVYVSFLIDVQEPPADAGGRLFAKLDAYDLPVITNNSGSTLMAGVWLTANNTLALSKSSNSGWGAESPTPLVAGTHLVVMRYRFNPEMDDDEVALWVDPPQAALNVPENQVPAPAVTLMAGSDVPSLSSFLLYHIGTEVVVGMFLDEFRLATSWAEVTSTQPLCVTASMSTHPADRTVNEGIAAILSALAGGTAPSYQWQVSTNGGSNWGDASEGVGGTTPTYWTRPLTPAESGTQYRAIATVACGGGSSATSTVATVTVVPAVPSSNGVVVDDVFQDYLYNNLPYGISNSVWFASTASSLDAGSGVSMLGTAQVGQSVLWLGYYTDDAATNLPVHLGIGQALKATLVFKANDITTNNGSLRIGLFDYADGGTRVVADGFGSGSSGNGQNVRGYMVSVNFGTNFSGNPFSLYARNNLGSGDLMGTTGNYLSLGGGPGGYAGAPAFQSGTNYTLEFTIARRSLTSAEVTVTVTGGGTNWTHTRVDNTYAYPRFDSIGFRAGNAENTASSYEFSKLLVEVRTVQPLPISLNVSRAGEGLVLSWSDPLFTLQAAPEVTGSYTNVPGAASPYTASPGEARKFYRLGWTAP